ncbi:hypothetical protein L596_002614 [Steinernema carpocapsae]|uniref:Acyl-CoA thioesterase-like C-terminal domain-containing protein n=1 Tax=Steinernema carpocapsae TaxID=34508 RepID=A0A4U8USN0_STECR|nr:hypothetical protein L596_002614 [Steinernema carpocapsae]
MQREQTLFSVLTPLRISSDVIRFNPPHMGGNVKNGRLFGGQTATQVAQSVKLLNPGTVIQTIKVNFVAPGSISIPVVINVEVIPETNLAIADVQQQGKVIATAKVMFGSSADLLSDTVYVIPQVPSPLNCIKLAEYLKTFDEQHPWKFLNLLVKGDFFEMRPVDIDHITNVPVDRKSLQVWCKIERSYRGDDSLANIDGISVALLLSDYLVAVAAHINLLKYHRECDFGVGASLSHMVSFHEISDVDSEGWFLYNSNCRVHFANRYMIEAQIFDTRGRCLLSSIQEGYLSSN